MTLTTFLESVANKPAELKERGLRIDWDEQSANKVAAMELYVVLQTQAAWAKAILREKEAREAVQAPKTEEPNRELATDY